jgi:hypothetical protein
MRYKMDEAISSRGQILDNAGNGIYTTIWSIQVEKDGSPSNIKLYSVIDNTTGQSLPDFQPSDVYINKVKQQLSKLEWSYSEGENSEPCEQTAYCYLLMSNPDEPQCSNNLER